MSFQEEKRESIKRYMLEKIRQDDEAFVQKTMQNFGISVTTVKRYIKDCLDKKIIAESTEQKTQYQLCVEEFVFSYANISVLSEDEIYCTDIRPLMNDVSKNALSIWYYAFSEMMNNAIEHSGAEHITCIVRKDYLYTEISIIDDGIGIYKNVRSYLEENLGKPVSNADVILELHKGKLTTNVKNHSGEGIFFTSKVLNEFAIWSENTIFSCGCYQKTKFVESHLISYYNRLQQIGTMVAMKLENQTVRTIKEVFDMYAPMEDGFVKTRIPIAEVCPYAEPIARSQARRILYRLELFKRVEFDFTGVEFMGQGFADEIFRVFHNQYPEIELIPLHANETVLGMIKHVRR